MADCIHKKNLLLSIESSCDDSSIAITCVDDYKIVFSEKVSQESEHDKYGGVVPELASRLHLEALPKIFAKTKKYFPNLCAVAVTTAPGLKVSLTQGVSMAKAISIGLDIPLIPINHLQGHIYSLFIEKKAQFPMCCLLVSGGHTKLMQVEKNSSETIGETMDDSFGESYDKVAKMLGLSYPGGPIVEQYALSGDENRYAFPVPLRQSPQIMFSYSGLKNAVRIAINKEPNIDKQTKSDICASFQKSAVSHIIMKLKKYFKTNPPQNFAVVGGASANIYLQDELKKLLAKFDCANFQAPLIKYCGDNAEMIGRCAIEKQKKPL